MNLKNRHFSKDGDFFCAKKEVFMIGSKDK